MSLTSKDVEHIAKLARLNLSEAQKNRYLGQLSAILEHVAKLQILDTSSIPPMTSAANAAGQLRADEPRASLSVADVLRNAPDQDQDQFKIPPVFE